MVSPRVLFPILIAVALAWSTAAPAQERIRFGAPVKASSVPPSDHLLALSTSQPARELAEGAELVLVSGYEPARNAAGMAVTVNVDRPGAKVLLVLTCHEKVNWQVTATPGTTISGILVSGYYPPTVTTTLQTSAYLSRLPYVTETENANFKGLLARLNALFGVDRVEIFRGSYSIPATVSISALDPPRSELTLKGPLPQRSNTDFAFDLLATDYSKVRWTLGGPVGKDEKAYVGEGMVAVSQSGKDIYRLNHDQLEILDAASGQTAVAALPANFPRFSWAMDIAYDTRRMIVSVVTLGGEGFLYRYDARRREWLDYRSLNDVDIHSLTYDAKADRYVAWTDDGNLLFISGKGDALFTRSVLPKLQGYGRLYDRGNRQAPRVVLAAKGDDVALVHIDGKAVSRIWHYKLGTDEAVLTYARD